MFSWGFFSSFICIAFYSQIKLNFFLKNKCTNVSTGILFHNSLLLSETADMGEQNLIYLILYKCGKLWFPLLQIPEGPLNLAEAMDIWSLCQTQTKFKS